MIFSDIMCDGCGLSGDTEPHGRRYGRWRAHAARDALRSAGWRTGLYRGEDHCPRCAAERKGCKTAISYVDES